MITKETQYLDVAKAVYNATAYKLDTPNIFYYDNGLTGNLKKLEQQINFPLESIATALVEGIYDVEGFHITNLKFNPKDRCLEAVCYRCGLGHDDDDEFQPTYTVHYPFAKFGIDWFLTVEQFRQANSKTRNVSDEYLLDNLWMYCYMNDRWMQNNGTLMYIKDLGTMHLLNICGLLQRFAAKRESVARDLLFNKLTEELKKHPIK